jgi:non-specific serine/threonine protein kinase
MATDPSTATATAAAAAAAAAATACVTPSGHLTLVEVPGGDRLAPDVARELAGAFAAGEGAGLLALGAALVGRPLPPSLVFFRELGQLFLSRLCAMPDLDTEERRSRLDVPSPGEELDGLLEGAPPIIGGEYLSRPVLERMWSLLVATCREELRRHGGTVQEYLQSRNPVWNTVGRVHFHLAERKADLEKPFAFLATYTTRVGREARAQHLPLGRALEEYAGARNRDALLSLLQPVQRAAAASPLAKELVDSGDVFHPQAWEPARAYAFLKAVPHFEAAGVVVKVPDWWKMRQAPRPQVRVTVGSRAASGLGLEAMLDFRVDLALDGEPLTAAEWEALEQSTEHLVRLRGRWVELDRDRLEELLAHWRALEKARRGGVSFLEAMRLLSGVESPSAEEGGAVPGATPSWVERTAGPWLEEALARLRDPAAAGGQPPMSAGLRSTLRPYQVAGTGWLHQLNRLGLGGCLADDMGLGKTLQVLALFEGMRSGRTAGRPPHLLVVPASLLANWKAEATRFTPSLALLVAHPSARPDRPEGEGDGDLGADLARRHDVVVTSYGYLARLPWALEMDWDTVVLDEAQAIKNPGSKQAQTVKKLRSRVRLALTGTPIENRLGDLWSLFDFLNPGLLGSAKAFGDLTRSLTGRDHDAYAPLRRLIRPYLLRRLKTDRSIISDLPEKTELTAYCPLTKAQAALYAQAVQELSTQLATAEGIRRRGVVLAFLGRFKQICNHPSHWLGDGAFRPEDSGKMARLRELCEPLALRQDKVLVFTQYREMTGPVADFLAGVFGRPGLVLHGQTAVGKRREVVETFQSDAGPPFMVLSLKAGGVGLNLTAAAHVVHFDRWWNPAVEDQATDRAFRIGQKRNVIVHKFVCRGTVEERIDAMLSAKKETSRAVLSSGGEVALTELSDSDLLEMVRLDIHAALAEN